jgi:hypothetical protein
MSVLRFSFRTVCGPLVAVLTASESYLFSAESSKGMFGFIFLQGSVPSLILSIQLEIHLMAFRLNSFLSLNKVHGALYLTLRSYVNRLGRKLL